MMKRGCFNLCTLGVKVKVWKFGLLEIGWDRGVRMVRVWRKDVDSWEIKCRLSINGQRRQACTVQGTQIIINTDKKGVCKLSYYQTSHRCRRCDVGLLHNTIVSLLPVK